jgi:Mrp family chromosome partitioning ATPase
MRATDSYSLSLLPPLRGNTRQLALGDPRLSRRVSNSLQLLRLRIDTLAGLSEEQAIRSLMLTSMNRDEDRSFVARNLAESYAQANRRVIVVGVGTTSSIEGLTGAKNEVGYSDLLAGTADVDKALTPTKNEKVHIIGVGKSQVAVTAASVAAVHAQLLERADIVIYDGPSYVFPFDIQSVGSAVEGTVLVVKPGVPKRNMLAHAADVLRSLNATFFGVVVANTLSEEVTPDIVRYDKEA